MPRLALAATLALVATTAAAQVAPLTPSFTWPRPTAPDVTRDVCITCAVPGR